MNKGFLHIRSFRVMHLSSPRYSLTKKKALQARKVFESFEKQALVLKPHTENTNIKTRNILFNLSNHMLPYGKKRQLSRIQS